MERRDPLESLRSDALKQLLFSLLHASLSSSRRLSLCRPFPCKQPHEVTPQDVCRLRDGLRALPSFEIIRAASIAPESRQVLEWCATSQARGLSLLSYAQFRTLHPDVPEMPSDDTPSFVVAINREDSHTDRMIAQHGSTFAFHGSPLENFHSILHNGLSVRFTQLDHGVYGDGVYFSRDPKVARGYVTYGDTAPHCCHESLRQRSIGCLAVCEVALHPSVKRHTSTATRTASSMPDSYLVVTNDHLIKMRWLFVFSKPQLKSTGPSILMWCVMLYALILVLAAAIKSPHWTRFAARYP